MHAWLPAALGTAEDLPSGSEHAGRRMARALGTLLALGGISALLWLVLPHPPQAREWHLLGLTLAVLVLGGALLAGAGDRLAPHAFVAITAAATVVIGLGVFYAGPRSGGLELFYLWAAAYAFAFFPLRWAAAIAALVAAGYAAALAAGAVPANEAIGRWLLCAGTVAVVGLLVRRLVDHRRASEQRFVRGFADSSIGMGLLTADWRWFEVNDALCRMLRRPRQELIGRSPAEITHPEDVAASRAIVDRALASPAQRAQTFTKRYLRPDGATVWTRVDSIFVARERREGYFFAQIRDISAEARAAEEHARQAAQQAAAARLGRFALAEQDLDAVMEEVARVIAETLGVEHSGVLELSGDDLRLVAGVGWEPGSVRRAVIPGGGEHPVGRAVRAGRAMVIEDAWAPDAPDVAEVLRRRGVSSGITVQIAGRDGPWGILTAHSRRPRRYAADETDFMTAVANVVSGAVDRHLTEEDFRHAALHDALTGLPNRALALDRLEGALARRRRDGRDVAVLLVDLDLFKLVNDSYGHGTGDELLIMLAPRLHDAVRPGDTVARLGGDEFLVVCEQLDGARAAMQVAERVAHAVSQPIVLRSGEHFVTASIGIALADSADPDTEALIRDADAAMYRAKERGRGRYELFDDLLRERVLTRLRTETELRRALERDELRVVFQPVVELGDGAVTAVEALVRWQHPDRGLLEPVEFIAVAEDSGLIHPLGRWVLEAACREGAALQRRFPRADPLVLCVNTSARQIADGAFPAEVAAIARRSGLAPGSLALEITETVLMEEAHAPVTVLAQLRDYGLRLMLDDFGTGYSSLAYLRRFPLDVVKVDRSFISGLGRDDEDSAIVAAVISMAHTLGLTVVAEGVERAEQVEQLRRLGCDRVQGRLLAGPMPAAALESLMAAGALRP